MMIVIGIEEEIARTTIIDGGELICTVYRRL